MTGRQFPIAKRLKWNIVPKRRPETLPTMHGDDACSHITDCSQGAPACCCRCAADCCSCAMRASAWAATAAPTLQRSATQHIAVNQCVRLLLVCRQCRAQESTHRGSCSWGYTMTSGRFWLYRRAAVLSAADTCRSTASRVASGGSCSKATHTSGE